ncbi:MAG: OmpA/MotB family protein [Jejuia sp.]
MKKLFVALAIAIISFSCVSKKKYLALQEENGQIKSELLKTRVAKEDLETKFAKIEARVEAYNSKITALQENLGGITEESNAKFETLKDGGIISNNAKEKMLETLEKVDQNKLAQAKTLKDSMNLAVAYNLEKAINSTTEEDEDFEVNIDGTVVMISIADNMLFNTGSYRLSSKADTVLKKLADVINSEPSLDVMVEGHTDARTINTEFLSDNWDLSVMRATSVVRKLQKTYNVAPEKLIAAGRSSYQPIAENNSRENRAKNRRTKIIILPNIDKFFALMSETENTVADNSILD